MKKLFSFVLILVMLTLVTVSCTPTESPDPVSSDALTIAGSTLLGPDVGGSEQAATQTPTTTELGIVLSEDERIARLTKEDGTGEIYFGQPVTEIMKVLDNERIIYEIHYFPEPDPDRISYLELRSGTSYGVGLYNAVLTDIIVQQTFSGVKVGDTVAKVTQIYGEQEPTDFNGGIYLWYYFPNGGREIQVSIAVNGHEATAKVTNILMMYKEDHNGGSAGY
jgi:hypothetical protein